MKDQILKIVTTSLSLILILIVSGSRLAFGKVEEIPEKYAYPEHLLPPEIKNLYQRIKQYTHNQKYQEAIKILENTRKRYPDNVLVQVHCYNALGSIYFHMKEYEQSLQTIKSCLKLIPPDDENYARYWILSYWTMANDYQNLGDYDKALEVSLKLITEYPDFPFFVPYLTVRVYGYLEKKGESHKIPKTYEDLAKEHPNTPVEQKALMQLARYYKKQKDYEQAALKYQELINKFPDDIQWASYAKATIKQWKEEGKIKELPVVAKKVVVRELTRQQLVRFIGIPLVALIALIYISILIVRWRKKKK